MRKMNPVSTYLFILEPPENKKMSKNLPLNELF